MKIQIPKTPSFDVPEGDYRARITDVVDVDRCSKLIRMKFEIVSPVNKQFQYLAGKNYCADSKESDSLIEAVRLFLGDKLPDLQDENGEFDPKSLVNMEVDIRIEHIHNDNYDKPFVHVAEIHPPGRLVPDAVN